MDEEVKNGFDYIKTTKQELDSLIIGRNELAKWQKRNSFIPKIPNSLLFGGQPLMNIEEEKEEEKTL